MLPKDELQIKGKLQGILRGQMFSSEKWTKRVNLYVAKNSIINYSNDQK